MDAAVVELDALADAVGPAAEDDDLLLVGDADLVIALDDRLAVRADHLVLVLVGAVVVGGDGLELGGAGVDESVGRLDRERLAMGADLQDRVAGDVAEVEVGELGVGVSPLLGLEEDFVGEFFEGAEGAEDILELDHLLELVQEERIDLRQLVHLRDRPPHLEGVPHVVQPPLAGDGELAGQLVEGDGPLDGRAVSGAEAGAAAHARREIEDQLIVLNGAHGGEPLVVLVKAESEALDVHRADDLLEGLLKGAADGHGLANGLHLGGEGLVGLGELLEGPARHLGDDVVDGGLEAGARRARDVVAEFVERVADGEFGGDLGDGEAGRLGGERGGARNARVHLHNHHLELCMAVFVAGRVGVDSELDVAAARLDAHRAHDGDRGVAHRLVFLVGEREDGCDGDGIAGVDAHRIDVLDAADDDAVVLAIADDLELVLLPPDDRLIDLDLCDHGGGEAACDDVSELVFVVRDAAAGAAESEGGSDDGGEADLLEEGEGILHRGDGLGLGEVEADGLADVLELLAVFGAMDDLAVGADHLDAELGEGSVVEEFAGAVEGGLSAEGGEDDVDLADGRVLRGGALPFGLFELALDDLADGLGGDGLYICSVGERRIGHDRRRVGVHQDDPVPLGAQRLACLCT